MGAAVQQWHLDNWYTQKPVPRQLVNLKPQNRADSTDRAQKPRAIKDRVSALKWGSWDHRRLHQESYRRGQDFLNTEQTKAYKDAIFEDQ